MNKISTRTAYGEALAEIGGDERIDVLDADLQCCTRTEKFGALYPERSFNVGIAEANMIGVARRIIIFDDNGSATVMFNPEIVKCSGAYEAEEGCLSLTGTRKAKRYRSIKVQYQNEQFQTRPKTYTGWTAQIIQHEIDHCCGVLI